MACKGCCCHEACLVCNKAVEEGTGYHVSYRHDEADAGKTTSLMCGRCRLSSVPKRYTGCIACGRRGSPTLTVYRRTVGFFCGTRLCTELLEEDKERVRASWKHRREESDSSITLLLRASWGLVRHAQPSWCVSCPARVTYQESSAAFLLSTTRGKDTVNVLYLRCRSCTRNGGLVRVECVGGCDEKGDWRPLVAVPAVQVRVCSSVRCGERGDELMRLILERKERCRRCERHLDDAMRCSGCRMIPYCGETCQEEDSSRHASECLLPTVQGIA
jgi:hypothetical protein